jgi:hypothetical protein
MTTKMMKREEEGVSARPHAQFKQDILDQIKAFSPASVLESDAATDNCSEPWRGLISTSA